MDDDPDFNLGYDAMIADTYESDFPKWFDYLQNGDYDEDDWYTFVKSLRKTLEWTCCKYYKEYERFNSTAVNIISEQIQLLGELRSLTEMDLFATHLPPLPVDVQRVIGKMLCAKC